MVPSIIWTAAPDGTITFVNQRWYDYCGLTPENNARHWNEQILHPDDRDRRLEAWNRALKDGTPYEIEVRNRRHDGEYRWFMSRAVPLKDEAGNLVCWFGMTTDVHDQLEAKNQLFHADQRKNQFLAMLAHELRNPLAPIRSGLDILAMERGDETVTLMQQQVEHLVRLVDDLLDVSRIMHGRIELRRGAVSLKSIVEQACKTVRQLFDQKRQRLEITIPAEDVWFEADGVRLVQVLENLLTNASKYTHDEGHIELFAEWIGDAVVLRVKDNGMGMDRQFLPEVFDLFSQAEHSIDRSQGGLGIGLTLVQNIVELHGGKVAVHSDGIGKGSEFTVTLPLIEAKKPNIPATNEASKIATHRILVVDDNAGAALLLSTLLKKLRFGDVEIAHDGASCLEKVRLYRPDIVLLDIGLPEMDGYCVAREIRSASENDHILLVALTGYGQEEDRRQSKEAGFDVHLVKPPSMEQLGGLFTHPKLKAGTANKLG
jgi:PAS domain S-box-containing protein